MVKSRVKGWYKKNRDACNMLIGVILGLICGFTLKTIFVISPTVLTYLRLPGTLVGRIFLLLIVPLITASLSTGISAIKVGQNKRIVWISLLLIVMSTSFSSLFGLTMVSIIKPGVIEGHKLRESNGSKGNTGMDQMITSQEDVFLDVFMNLFPDNIIGATFMTYQTKLVPRNVHNLSEGYKKIPDKKFGPNLLGLVVISFIIGFALLHLQEKVHIIKSLLEETNTMVIEVVLFLMKFMPIAIFFFMMVDVIKMKDPGFTILIQLAWFGGTILVAFTSLIFIFYPIVYFLVVHKNPFELYSGIIPAVLVAFACDSSAMTLPTTMKCMEENNKLALPISHFFLPLGMTMHMPGTATYCPMVAIFAAQMHGISLSFALLVTLCIYSVVMSMAFPATPSQGGVVFFVTICVLIGIENPLEILAYIKALDLIIGRLRTAINITGDCILSKIIEKMCHYESEDHYNDEGNAIEHQELKEVSRLLSHN